MGLAKPFYKLAWSVRQGPLGEGLAKMWHKFAPSIDIWKNIYGLDMCVDLRDSLIWWAMDPVDIKEYEGFHQMLTGVKGNVWDVGCNVGVFALYAASQGNRVIAFDISPKAIRLLEKSALRNKLSVKPVARAFAVESFKYSPPADADTRNRPGASASAQDVTSMTFLEAEKEFGRPDFIKLDIEHAETDFLKSTQFREWIKVNKIPLLVEMHEKAYWDLVWPEVPHYAFNESHVFFNPPPSIAAAKPTARS